MRTIEKKILPEYFEAILSGKKNWELRLNEFDIEEGDTLVLREIDPETREYTGRQIRKTITGVSKFKPNELYWPVEEVMEKGLQIISF